MINIKYTRIILWLILALVISFLLYLALVPTGKITYVYGFYKQNYHIKKFTPFDRVELINNGSQKITGDPVYFTLATSRPFEKALLTLRFKNPSNIPIIEAGVLVDKKIWRYRMVPVNNVIINRLAKNWHVIKRNGIILLQRTKQFDSIDNFFAKLPDNDKIATYNYEVTKKYLLPSYHKSNDLKVLNYSLRGNYQFYTYVKDENLDLDVSLFDLNKNKDFDSAELRIYSNNKLISQKILPDDGNSKDNGMASDRGSLNVNIPNLPEGIYKIELSANDDIVTNQIKTHLQKMAFINKLWLYDSQGKDVSLFTNSQTVNAQTVNPAKLQTIKINNNSLKIEETYRQYSQEIELPFSLMKIEKDDIVISGDGLFSFNESEFINPDFKKVIGSFNPDKSGVDYIIANYNIPQVNENGWSFSQSEINLGDAYKEQPAFWGGTANYSLILSAPGLKADDKIKNFIEISEIKLDLSGINIWQKIKKVITKND